MIVPERGWVNLAYSNGMYGSVDDPYAPPPPDLQPGDYWNDVLYVG